MEIFPKEARVEAEIARERTRYIIAGHYEDWDSSPNHEDGAIAPPILFMWEKSSKYLVYPLAVATNSLKYHVRNLRSHTEITH